MRRRENNRDETETARKRGEIETQGHRGGGGGGRS